MMLRPTHQFSLRFPELGLQVRHGCHRRASGRAATAIPPVGHRLACAERFGLSPAPLGQLRKASVFRRNELEVPE